MTNMSIISSAGGRPVNEDYSASAEAGGLICYLIADGLGGHRGGALASKTAGEAVVEAFRNNPALTSEAAKAYLAHACDKLAIMEKQDTGLAGGLKTTIVLLLLGQDRALWAHLGDSRLYMIQSGKLILQTSDHSVPQKLADSGFIKPSQIRFHEDRNRLTAALSSRGSIPLKVGKLDILQPGDIFLLCSDGFWEYVLEEEMTDCLADEPSPEQWLQRMEAILLRKVQPGHDNYSAMAVFV